VKLKKNINLVFDYYFIINPPIARPLPAIISQINQILTSVTKGIDFVKGQINHLEKELLRKKEQH